MIRPAFGLVTEQYLIGQLSALLADLETPARQRELTAVRDLRLRIERAPTGMLPRLAGEAIGVSDACCWTALEAGDAAEFRCCAQAAGALVEFIAAARLACD